MTDFVTVRWHLKFFDVARIAALLRECCYSYCLKDISKPALSLIRKRFRKGAFLLKNIAIVLSAGLVVLMIIQTGAFSFSSRKTRTEHILQCNTIFIPVFRYSIF